MSSTSFSIYKIIFLFFTIFGIALFSQAVFAAKYPQYASIADYIINIRTGPGKRYPIKWVVTRKDMPVKILREFENWREIVLFDGKTKGWVYKNLLSKKKTAITVDGIHKMYKKPDKNSKVMLKLEKNVIVEIDHCKIKWCNVEISGYKGWIEKPKLWGVEDY